MAPHPQRTTRDSYIVAGLHVLIAMIYWRGFGVSIVHDFGPDKWGWFSQNLPTDLLLERATESLWALHTQPPFWNALGAVFIQTFGSLHMPMLQLMHIAMGAGIAVLGLRVVSGVTGSSTLGLALGLILALHPALFLYEAYALYTTTCAFLVMLGVFLLHKQESAESRWPLVTFIAVVTLLTLTRSVYHALLPALFAAFYWRSLRPLTRRQVVILALSLLLPLAWYGKNQVQYGFFGTSSWYGIGMWRVALFQQDEELLRELYEGGELHPVVTIEPFSPPAAYRFLGFDEESDVPALSRNDLHNINYPAISAEYRAAAVTLIRRAPKQYLRNVVTAYGNFSDPSTRFAHLNANRERIAWHATAEQWLLGRPLVARLEAAIGDRYFGSFYFVLFPAMLLLFVARVWRREGGPLALLRPERNLATHFMASIVAYTILVTCTMELGENVRFKFMIEPAFLTLTSILLYQIRRERRGKVLVAGESENP